MATNGFRAIIIGAPASGKGTISGRIIKNFNLKHISSGDILRQNIEKQTSLGIEAKKYMDEGALVPDDLVTNTVSNEICASGNSWLLDGFPRTKVQAEYLWKKHKVDAVLNLVVPFDVIIDRVRSRWIHLPSGRVYNIGFNDPKVPFRDDETGEPLVQRPDDQPVAVQKRLDIYESITRPVLDFYKMHKILHEFAGRTSNEIWPKVLAFLNKNFVT